MNDTSPEMERIVNERYRQMTPDQRMRIASQMFETARKLVESSLPASMSRKERRLAWARRMYEGELSEQALLAFADWTDEVTSPHLPPAVSICCVGDPIV